MYIHNCFAMRDLLTVFTILKVLQAGRLDECCILGIFGNEKRDIKRKLPWRFVKPSTVITSEAQATDGAERAADVIFKINDFLDTTKLGSTSAGWQHGHEMVPCGTCRFEG